MPPDVGIAILVRKFLFGICCKIAGGAHLSGLIVCAPSFFLFVLEFFSVRRLLGFSLVRLSPIISRRWFGMFRLCGGDKGSALDLRGLCPSTPPASRRWTRDLRPHFVVTSHFAPLSIFSCLCFMPPVV